MWHCPSHSEELSRVLHCSWMLTSNSCTWKVVHNSVTLDLSCFTYNHERKFSMVFIIHWISYKYSHWVNWGKVAIYLFGFFHLRKLLVALTLVDFGHQHNTAVSCAFLLLPPPGYSKYKYMITLLCLLIQGSAFPASIWGCSCSLRKQLYCKAVWFCYNFCISYFSQLGLSMNYFEIICIGRLYYLWILF